MFYIGDVVGWSFFAVNREGGKRTKIWVGRRSGREYVGGGKSLVRDKRNITHRTFDKETATSNLKVTMPAVTGDKSN